MNRHHFVALLLTFALAACHSTGGSSASRAASLNQEIQLAPGERATFDQQLDVEFVRVVEDSRCPSDTTCVWAGEVKVQLSIRSSAGEASSHEIVAGQSAAVGEYRVLVLQVQPMPVSTRKISPNEYRVALRVERT